MIGSVLLLASMSAMSGGYAPAPFLPGAPVVRTRCRMPTTARRRTDPDKKRRRKARQAAQRRNRKR